MVYLRCCTHHINISHYKKKNDCDDRGAFTVFQEIMHSWVGYELIKALLIFGLDPKIRDDPED
jgi:hypothetical protein